LSFRPAHWLFGDWYFENSSATTLDTQFGKLRIITPTQCVMERLAWYVLWHADGNDGQSWDQAVLVVRHQTIDWSEIEEWAANDGIDSASMRLRFWLSRVEAKVSAQQLSE